MKSTNFRNNWVFIFAFFVVVSSCKEEASISFSDKELTIKEDAEISIIYPEATGDKQITAKINNAVENYISSTLLFSEEESKNAPLQKAITTFTENYSKFKTDFPESNQKWIASIEGEIVYQSPEIITISVNSYLDTGGAHGNDVITFLNFNAKTGETLGNSDILDLNDSLNILAEQYFKSEVITPENTMSDYFFGEHFHLPANIGFSEEGVIFLYNVYEIASYAQGYTEFVIPFDEIDPFLKVQ